MKIEKIDLSQERQIITMMIVSTQFLNQIIPILKVRLFKSSYAKIVAKWILDYYDEFKQAPEKNIQSIYQSKVKTLRNEEDTELISDFLSKLSKDYENESTIRNIDFIVKESIKYLKLSSLELLKEEIEECLLKDDIIVAENKIANYKRIEKPVNKSIRLLYDSELIAKAFTDQEESIFRFPGVLGGTCGDFLRGDLVAFLAASKRGKCIAGDSLVQLADGNIKTIQDLVKENKRIDIISLNENTLQFEKSQIEDFVSCGIHPVYEIELRTGRKIICAETHPFLTFDGWKKLKDLKIGDRIAVGKNINIFGNLKMPRYKVCLLAYLLADGGLTGTNITFTKKEYNIMNDFIKCVYSIGDYISWDDDIHIRIRNKGHKSNKKTQTRLFLESIGIDRCKSIHKKIPDCVFLFSKKSCSLFLSVLFTCDGSVFSNKRKKPEIEYSSGSRIMIDQIQLLLTRFNIMSIIKSKKVKEKYYYSLCIRDKENILRFFNEIGFLFSKKKKMEDYLNQLNNVNSYGCIFTNFPKEMREKVISIVGENKKIKRFFNIESNKNYKSIRKKTVEQLNKIIKSKELDKYLSADIFWDEMKSVIFKGNKKCYDLSIRNNHNYIANGIICHNSWWQWCLSYMSMFSGLRVVFFSLEMTENQIKRRAWQSLVAQPKKDMKVEIPYFMESDNNKWLIEKKKVFKKGVNIDEIEKKQKRFRMISRGGDVWIKVIPAGSFSIDDIIIEIDNMRYYDKCIPDIIVIDYADILRPSRSVERKEIRHQLDYTWRTMRGLAQEKNVLVVTASQTNRAGYKQDVSEDLCAEDKRKIDHVSKMMGINRTKEDLLNGMVRISHIVERDGKIDHRQVAVLNCLEIGRPYIDSRYADEVEL
jgi:intein/homing endonuclease